MITYLCIGAMGIANAAFGQGSGSIWLSNVGCNGTEERLLDCSTSAFGSHTCSHSRDAGVRCNISKIEPSIIARVELLIKIHLV